MPSVFRPAALVLALIAPAVAGADDVIITGGGCTVTPAPAWKNTLDGPYDPFVVSPFQSPVWVKFTILLCDPQRVYFQNSNSYAFHHPFASQHLDPFIGLSVAQFDQLTLHAAGQQAVLGAVLFPPTFHAQNEMAVQLVRRDAYTREQVRDFIQAVRSAVTSAPFATTYYFPTFEQQASAASHADWLAAQDPPIVVGTADRWVSGAECYSSGWTIGRLRFVTASQVPFAFLNGTLTPADVLLTDAVPAQLPPLAGIISLTAATPNSHVAILAQTYGVPFVHLPDSVDQTRARSWDGRRVILSAYPLVQFGGGCDLRLLDATPLAPEQNAELLALKLPPPLNIEPLADPGSYAASTAGMTVADVRFYGGKAANSGYLRRGIPAHSPPSIGISFRLWSEFCEQPFFLQEGASTLRDAIDLRLAGHAWPPDMIALENDLSLIRGWFTDAGATHFTPAQQAALLAILADPQYGFDAGRNLRFRSSTNVEDTQSFSGAGLYDSYSGCLADDLDGDARGPSICNPAESSERGVFRAIRKVFGSFYNTNAYLERLRRSVDEQSVGMALLVHHSYPDPIEMANGVATLHPTFADHYDMRLVTQLGAVSVTNPDGGGAAPEVVRIEMIGGQVYPTIEQYSNLVQLGVTVMPWDGHYRALASYLQAAALQYRNETGRHGAVLDFEYKRVAPDGRIEIKQIREIPQPAPAAPIAPFLLNEPRMLCTEQGEHGDIFALHRLKLRFRATTRNLRLTAANLTESIYSDSTLAIVSGCDVRRLAGPPGGWPLADYEGDVQQTVDRWRWAHAPSAAQFALTTYLPAPVSSAQSPIKTLRDLGISNSGCLYVSADYAAPRRSMLWDGSLGTTVNDLVAVCPCRARVSGARTRDFAGDDGVRVETTFYWPAGPSGIVAGYTAPLAEWEQTVIEGLTSRPMVLRDYYAQTYRPGHHNFTEDFLFEPRLDPGVPADLIAELEAQGVAQVLVIETSSLISPQVLLLGPEDPCPQRRCAAGDMNCDGRFDNFDIDPFVLALTDRTAYLAAYPQVTEESLELIGDVNGDLRFDNFDIDAFVAALLAAP
ncbi:MAG: hypothetical protein HRU75_01165 [Planctomycetia bacterium]|nr:MAG: hypothetical protein HRU75_01165 [Planctomycetia bacterium]